MGKCRNCGTELSDQYCPHCGQKRDAGKGVPIFSLVGNILEHAFALEGKTFRTLGTLFWRPGRLTRHYMEGRIERYTHPTKLFWLSTLLIVALSVAALNTAERQGVIEEAWTGGVEQADSLPEADSLRISIFNAEGEAPDVTLSHKDIMPILREATTSYGAYVSVALIPFFALLLYLFYWRRRGRIYYMYHMVFALHFHAFVNLLFAPVLLWEVLFPQMESPRWLTTLVSLAVVLLPGIYIVIASKRFYAPQRWRWVILKTLIFTTIYFAVTLIIVGIILLLTISR